MKWWKEIGPRQYQASFVRSSILLLMMLGIIVNAIIQDWQLVLIVASIVGPISLIGLWHSFIAVCVQRDKLRGKIPGDWDEFVR